MSTTSNTTSLIRCIPKHLHSYDLCPQGDGSRADLRFNWFVERGTIEIDRRVLEIQKHGPLSGHWTLDCDGQEEASAHKSSVLTRSFEIQDSTANVSLRAISPFGRGFCIEESGQEIATIKPDHLFTRRSTIQMAAKPLAFTTVAFAFWLVVLMWRRGDDY
ncbi:MAG: hypothetical protein K0U98_10570 [Deltaproteobacteria bacterium]|nr:hypothetical protein [Deltaproteobacteria bacterium]